MNKKLLMPVLLMGVAIAQLSPADILLGGFDGNLSSVNTSVDSIDEAYFKQDASVVGDITMTGVANTSKYLEGAGTDSATWGTYSLLPVASSENRVANDKDAGVSLTISVDAAYDGTEDVTLNDFVMDLYKGGADTATLTYTGGDLEGVAIDTVVATLDLSAQGGSTWSDYNISFASLVDVGLAAGQSASFSLAISDFSNNSYSRIDNVGIVGTIPEPATMGLLGFAAVGLSLFRRRFKR